MDSLTIQEPLLRVAVFFAVFVLIAAWEMFAPRRELRFTRRERWPHNLGLLAVNTAMLRLLAPGAAVAVAVAAQTHRWGLLHALGLPAATRVVLAVVLLDLAIYVQHVVFHAVPVLWRLHRVHHADTDFDVTTGTRFHPIEIALSLVIKCAVVVAIGAPPLAVLVFEVVLNAASMFNHANASPPAGVDRWLRWLVVTPDMHRVHHSSIAQETNSNFGFNLPWWDRLFGTYRARPAAGHEAMNIGLDSFREPRELRLGRLLLQPFRPA